MAASTNFYAFFGSDEAQVKEAALRKVRQLAPPDDEFGLEVVAGQADNSDHAVQIMSQTQEAIATLPFFGGQKVVWLQGANFFADNITGRSQTTLDAVEGLVATFEQGIPPDVVFVLSASEVDKRRSFYKKVSKLATVEAFDKIDVSKSGWEDKAILLAGKIAKEINASFEPAALEKLVLLVGADTRLLKSEIEKVSLFAPDRSITEADVEQLVSSSHAGIIFEIGDAIARKQLTRALALIDQQLNRGESAVGILLAAIIPKIRGMLHARDLVERHKLRAGRNYKAFEAALQGLPDSETAHLPRKKDGNISAYPIFLAAQSVERFTAKELAGALESCLEANRRLVTSSLDEKVVLQQLVTRILTGR